VVVDEIDSFFARELNYLDAIYDRPNPPYKQWSQEHLKESLEESWRYIEADASIGDGANSWQKYVQN
jgi:hypothetical protein